MRKTVAWATTDGKLFGDPKEAVEHEAMVDVSNWLRDQGHWQGNENISLPIRTLIDAMKMYHTAIKAAMEEVNRL